MTNQTGSLNYLEKLTHKSDARFGRISSADLTGGNKDFWIIPPKETITLAELDGPGSITHIWMTSFCKYPKEANLLNPQLADQLAPTIDVVPIMGILWERFDPDFYRKAVIKITWDDHKYPSVLVPFGDFFGICNSMPSNYHSIGFSVSCNPDGEYHYGGPAGMNCYFPMPFRSKAKIEMINEGERPFGLYFHIDYELYRRPLPEDTLYFHSSWRRESPTDGWGSEIPANTPEVNAALNPKGEGNFVILDTKGSGHYVGCNVFVAVRETDLGVGWCEGDDMIFIDGEEYPSVMGTGTEDYFNHGFGIQRNSHMMYAGSIINEIDVPGNNSAYRFHILDPIYFDKSIKVTIEHGHANHCSDDWSATAYWYSTLMDNPLTLQNVEERLHAVAGSLPPVNDNLINITPEQRALKEAYAKRKQNYFLSRISVMEQNEKRAAEFSAMNRQRAKAIHEQTQK